MTAEPSILDSDFRYIDGRGNLMRTRTELAIAQMLAFMDQDYEYDVEISAGPETVRVDFKTKHGMIEVIDSAADIKKYMLLRQRLPDEKLMAIGRPEFAARIDEMQQLVCYDGAPQTGSIFLEDQSFSFDYAHILPLVEKCSILHGHTSSVMVELAGQMKDNILLDFGVAKKIIKEVVAVFDHKFFINKKYLAGTDQSHYRIRFDGPKGMFDLQVPKDTTYLLEGEATVENLSSEIIRLLAPRLPRNVEAVGVYIYEGYDKGSHIISSMSR